MRVLKQKVSISLDEDIITKIRELSELDGRSFSQYINNILKKHIDNYAIERFIYHERGK